MLLYHYDSLVYLWRKSIHPVAKHTDNYVTFWQQTRFVASEKSGKNTVSVAREYSGMQI